MGGEKMGGEEAGLPQQARDGLALLFRQYQRLDAEVGALDRAVLAEHENNPVSRCLASQPGVGPLTAVSFALKVADPRGFRSARHFAAWLGLTPKEHSTGGRQRLGGISREGDERLRQLLVLGATARIKAAKPGRSPQWLLALLARRPKKVAAVALANKMARTLWAMMISGELYREPGPRGLARPGHAEASAQAS
jgi:transposase